MIFKILRYSDTFPFWSKKFWPKFGICVPQTPQTTIFSRIRTQLLRFDWHNDAVSLNLKILATNSLCLSFNVSRHHFSGKSDNSCQNLSAMLTSTLLFQLIPIFWLKNSQITTKKEAISLRCHPFCWVCVTRNNNSNHSDFWAKYRNKSFLIISNDNRSYWQQLNGT